MVGRTGAGKSTICLSNCLVYLFTDLIKEQNTRMQVVVNKCFKNLVRNQEYVYVWNHDKMVKKIKDKFQEIDELPLDSI